jgi:hypothetical protein
MARRKNLKDQPKTALLEIPSSSDLPLRLEKISEQTGLSPLNLLQKWILQEESLIGVIQRSKDPAPEQAGAKAPPHKGQVRSKANPSVSKSAKVVPSVPGNPNYRKTLVNRAKKLKKEGMTLKKIAETFNDEKVQTMSGTGKWYASSINNLLNSKK